MFTGIEHPYANKSRLLISRYITSSMTREGHQTMTAITHPIVTTHHVVGVVITAAISVAVAISLTLALATTKNPVSIRNLGRADAALCNDFTNATAGSPAIFRLADEISTQGSCPLGQTASRAPHAR
jgi:hypothetical protein